jgi:two-component system response regulator HydG
MTDPTPINEHFRRALMETIPCAVFLVDADRRIIFWNRSAEELTGYAAAEMLGSSCEPLRIRESDESDGRAAAAVCSHHAADGSVSECEIRRKDGAAVPVVRRARPVTDEAGRHVGAIVALVNVSVLKRAHSEIALLRHEIGRAGRFGELVGRSPAMQKLYEAIELIAETDASVVIEGPTGVGKELVARTLHARSRRREGVFLPVNCGALPDTLLDAELFGHVKGAFTGAVADRAGRFEQADGGTLLLDEVAELTPASQVRLLRVLQEGQITRVGESHTRPVDVRIIAATHRDLPELARRGEFREDLYYRLRVVGLSVPALADRREDIPLLAAHFIDRFNRKYDRHVQGPTPEAMARLTAFDWPGNVRQLEHAVEHAFAVTTADTTALGAEALPPELRQQTAPPRERGLAPEQRAGAWPLAEAPAPTPAAQPPRDERAAVLQALAAAAGNKSQAARTLGITRAGLYKRLHRLGIEA